MTDTESELRAGLILSCVFFVFFRAGSHITNAYSLKEDRDKNEKGGVQRRACDGLV